MNWKDKWYLIFGGSSGIGLAAARTLCGKGAHTVIVGRDREKLDRAVSALGDGESFGVSCDLRRPEEADGAFAACADRGLRLDGMVYSAGVSPMMTVGENDPDTVRAAYGVNVFSFLQSVRRFQEEGCVREEGGSIVAISSVAASQSPNRQSVYAGSKAALEASVRCMAKELLLRGIRVNALALGAVRTEMFDRIERENPAIESRYPLGAISPEEVSRSILYLLSDDTAHMTGTVLKLDSGHDVWLLC